jgi:hypothetical protein
MGDVRDRGDALLKARSVARVHRQLVFSLSNEFLQLPLKKETASPLDDVAQQGLALLPGPWRQQQSGEEWKD